MPIYYAPPQPVQASPHVPIGNQGDAPPQRTLHGFYAVRSLWSEPSWPAQYAPQIVAQTLTYGDQPPRRTNAQLYQLRATWPEPWWPAQSEPANAAFNIAVVNQPPASQLARIYNLRGLWPDASWPAQSAPRIAPQTLAYGDQPPRFKPRQPVWPQLEWAAQSEAANAGWNVPAVISPYIPPPQPQWQIWSSWQFPPQPVQRATTLVQLTGDQPPKFTQHLRMSLRGQWPEANWSAQARGPNASWNVARIDNPPVNPWVRWNIWTSWNIPPEPRQAKHVQNVNGISASTIYEVVPYLIEDPLSAALMRIASIYCVANVIGTTGSVTAQDPAAFTLVARGSTITITLGGTPNNSGGRGRARAPYGAPDTIPPFSLIRKH